MAKQWIKMYTEILSDPKMGRMSDKLFRRTVELFLIAGTIDNDGELPSVDDIAWMLHSTQKEIQTVIKDLMNLKIIETKSEKYFISHYAERQNSDLTRSEINKRYYEKSKQAKSENKTEIQTEVRPDSDVAMSEIQTLEIDKEIDKDKDIKELREVKESVLKSARDEKPAPKHKHGTYKHVLLTDAEVGELAKRFPDWEKKIQNLDDYLQNNRKKHYDDHYLTICKWADDDAEKAKAKAKQKQPESWIELADRIMAADGILGGGQ